MELFNIAHYSVGLKLAILKKLIKKENVQDLTSQKIFDLEKLVFYSY